MYTGKGVIQKKGFPVCVETADYSIVNYVPIQLIPKLRVINLTGQRRGKINIPPARLGVLLNDPKYRN